MIGYYLSCDRLASVRFLDGINTLIRSASNFAELQVKEVYLSSFTITGTVGAADGSPRPSVPRVSTTRPARHDEADSEDTAGRGMLRQCEYLWGIEGQRKGCKATRTLPEQP